MGGRDRREGRLEIKRANLGWGTVCSDRFDNVAAGVVCRQLDLGSSGTALTRGEFGQGAPASPVWLDEVTCTGAEQRIEECAHAGWGVSNCGHKEDVGVKCFTQSPGEVLELC